MDKDYENDNLYSLASLLASQQALAQGVQQLAMRLQKSSQTTTTTSTSTPRALADLIKTRDTIGGATTDLASALRGRENWGYALGNILSGIQADSTPGGWLAGLARGAGAGLTTMENIRQDTAKQLYDARMQDLANRLAYDKAMGETQTQNQSQTIKYENTPWSSGGKGAGAGTNTESPMKEASQMEITGGNLADLYQTIRKNPVTFSAVGGAKLTEEPRALRSAVSTKGLTDMGHREFMYLNSIMPKGFATAINTAAEQRIMRPYTTAFETGTGSAKKSSIVNMMGDIYDTYKNEAQAQGLQMPMSKQEYINQRLNSGRAYNPKYFTGTSKQMYETDASGEPSKEVREYDAAEAFMRGTV